VVHPGYGDKLEGLDRFISQHFVLYQYLPICMQKTHIHKNSYQPEMEHNKKGSSQAWWHTLVIPATQEVEAGGL
jgi:hypothetical protein